MSTEINITSLRFCPNCGHAINQGENYCPRCGENLRQTNEKPVLPPKPVIEKPQKPERPKERVKQPEPTDDSYFTGGAFANFFIGFLTFIVSVLSLFLAYPAMVCWKMRWKCKHTYINGKRLVFDGTGIQLFGKFLLWIFLSVITVGIYLIVAMPLNLNRWKGKHTHFEGVDESAKNSYFDGSIFGLLGVNLITSVVTVLTFFIGSFWAHCYKEKWFSSHEVIDGCRMEFNGTGMQYFCKKIVWVLLTVVTLGIYAFWLAVKTEKWTVSHKHARNKSDIPDTFEVQKDIDEDFIDVEKSYDNETQNALGRDALGLLLSLMSYFAIPVLPAIPGIVLCAMEIPKRKQKGTAITGIALGVANILTIGLTLLYFLVIEPSL